MSPSVSTTVTSSRGGTTLLFHFFAYLHGRRHLRKFAPAAPAAAATFAKLSIDFSSIFSAWALLSESERGGLKGKQKPKGGRTYLFCWGVFFFFTIAKARRAKEGERYMRFWQAGKENPFLLQFSSMVFCYCFFHSFRDHKREGGGSAIP